LILIILLTGSLISSAQETQNIFSGAYESTPSIFEYFPRINNGNEDTTTRQSPINLEFFKY